MGTFNVAGGLLAPAVAADGGVVMLRVTPVFSTGIPAVLFDGNPSVSTQSTASIVSAGAGASGFKALQMQKKLPSSRSGKTRERKLKRSD